jgi:predicted DNA-binding transcriptional regulator AlpA
MYALKRWNPDERSKMTQPEWLTINQVEAEYGIPVGTLYQWRHRRTGPRCALIGRRIRYRRADVERWIEEQFEAEEARRPQKAVQ